MLKTECTNRPGPVAMLAALLAAVLLAGCGEKGDSDNTANNVEANTRITRIDPAQLRAIGQVDPRFQSYNVESVEVTGGNFWAPYPKPGDDSASYDVGPHGVGFSTNAYRKREPINLIDNQRLRTLTKALGPAYMRVSGSWANNIYFQDNDLPPTDPPAGYQGVLTREQWAGVVDFARAVDAKILTSFAVSDGARDENGVWNPEQARRLFEYTHELGGSIDSVEFMNEPNVRTKIYPADEFARDHALMQDMVAAVSPDTLIVGPGSTGEAGFKLFSNPPEQMSTARLLSGKPQPRLDVFSYHYYGAVSQRCKSLGLRDTENPRDVTTSEAEALNEAWLSRADQAQNLYKDMRDRFAPGKPIWITETAQTACGGDPWASTFLDTFRYLDQLGRFAKNDVDIVFHNTLAASDYALIDDETWLPRPNYWAALLWRRLMGEVVLDVTHSNPDVHLYAHCQRNQQGGVALLAINLSRNDSANIVLSSASQRYTLTAERLLSQQVKLNDTTLLLAADDSLPSLNAVSQASGSVTLAPVSISLFAIPDANNPACR